MRLRPASVAALLATTTTLAASAQSQPWLKDRRFGEGIGLRAGNLELHPGVAAEFGYDSNYFQRSDAETVIDAWRLRATGSLSLTTLGAQRRAALAPGAPPSVTFDAGLHLSYNELIAADSEHSDLMSDQRHVDAGADFKLHVLPQRPWSFDAYGDYVRTVEPNNNNPVEDNAFDRDSLRLGAGINWRPGGGLFEWRAGYELGLHLFERSNFQEFNNVQHALKTRGRWRFLPRTAVLYDGTYTFVTYTNETIQNDGQTIKSMLGLAGLVTKHFALLGMAGWAASFYESRERNGVSIDARNYDDWIAHAEVKWFVMPQPSLEETSAAVGLSSVAAGYIRDFANSYLGSFYQRDRGYLKLAYFLGGMVVVSLEGGVSVLSFPQAFMPDGRTRDGTPFSETRIDATLFGEYRLSDIVGVNATVRYDQNINDNEILVSRDDPNTPGVVDPTFDRLDFERWRAFVGVRLFW